MTMSAIIENGWLRPEPDSPVRHEYNMKQNGLLLRLNPDADDGISPKGRPMDMNGNEAPNWVTRWQIDPKRALPRAAVLIALTLAVAMHAGLAGAETAAAPAGDTPSSAAEAQAAAPDADHPTDPQQAARE